jgi:TetR/AcrR family transcriptional regulator
MDYTRNRILDIALELFAVKGYDATGVAEITESAQVSKPVLYYHFKNKEGLLKEILRVHYEDFGQKLDDAAVYTPNPSNYSKDVRPLLAGVAKTYFEFARSSKSFCAFALSLSFLPELAAMKGAALPYLDAQMGTLEKMFFDISNVHGNLKGKEALLAKHFYALITASIDFWLMGRGELDEQDADLIAKHFMHGIFG